MRRFLLALCFFGLSGAAFAQDNDYWTGPYFGPTYGWGAGVASYVFVTDGYYNDAAGDTFSHPLSSTPIGVVLGHNWRNGNIVYGVEGFFHTHGVAAEDSCVVLFPPAPPGQPCGAPSPFNTGHDDRFDAKSHWTAGLNMRVGFARNRVLLYAQGGPALGHIVNAVQDTTNDLHITEYKAPASVFGLTGEVGIQFALSNRFSIGVGLRGTYLRPLRVNEESLDTNGDPAGAQTVTDHTLQISSHAVVLRLLWRAGQSDNPERRNDVPFEWGGPYWGFHLGALWQAGIFHFGYDRVINDRFLVGFSTQASINVCCGFAFEADVAGRVGYMWRDDVLLYGEAGVAYHSGTFFEVINGGYFFAGAGMEIALTPRMTAFMELKGGGERGEGFIDANFQAGVNFYIGRRNR